MKKRGIYSEFTTFINRNYRSKDTIETYDSMIKIFLSDNHSDSLKNLSTQYLQNYLDTILHSKSVSSYNQMLSVLKIMYRDILNQKYKLSKIKPLKQYRKLKNLPDIKFLNDKISKIDNIKHRCIILTLLSTGIRMSELLNIKISDVDSQRMKIRIHKGKGNKSRFVVLTKELLLKLRDYYKTYKPKVYLFEGLNGQYSSTSVNNIIKKYIGKEYHAHIFRHVYVSYMIEKNVNSRKIKLLTGHNSDHTLDWYYQYNSFDLERSINPINDIAS